MVVLPSWASAGQWWQERAGMGTSSGCSWCPIHSKHSYVQIKGKRAYEYIPKGMLLKNCENITLTKKTRWLLVPVSFSSGMLHGLLTSFWRDRNGTLPTSNLLTAICFQSAGEELAEMPCYKQLILKGRYIPTVLLRLRGHAPRQFSYKVSLWITNTAHLWSWGPFTLKSTERHLGLLYLEDYKIWEIPYIQRWLCRFSSLCQHLLFMCK